MVLLYSSLNSIVTCFRFALSEEPNSFPESSADPTCFTLSRDHNSHEEAHPIQSLTMERIDFGDSGYRPTKSIGIGYKYQTAGIPFYELKALYDNLDVRQVLMCEPPAPKSDIRWIKWSHNIPLRRKGSVKGHDNDFVVDESVEPPEKTPVRRRPFQSIYTTHRIAQQRLEKTDLGTKLTRTLDQSDLYRALANPGLSDDNELRTTFSDYLERIYDWLRDPDQPKDRQSATLLDRFGSAYWEDLDVESRQFTELLEAEGVTGETGEARWVLKQLQSTDLIGIRSEDQSQVSLSWLFDRILSSWIEPLPLSIPVQARVRAEKAARRIATEVYLANIVPAEQLQESQVQDLPEVPEADTPGLPIVPVSPFLRSSFAGTSQLPTPSATPSLISGSSFSTLSNNFSSSLARLQRFADFEQHPKTAIRDMDRFTAHWRVGADPQTYDFVAASNATADESNMSPRSRQRLQRRAEKLLRRQRKEAQKLELLARAQPVFVVTHRSSPAPVTRRFQSHSQQQQVQHQLQLPSSSQGTSEMPFPQSQVLPGAFGGRLPPPPLKKRKVGMAGFK